MSRVLLVDGDAQLRAALVASLTQDGHEVEVASSGASGLALARASSPTLVIFEYALGDMTAAEFVRQLRDVTSIRPALIVLTAALAEADRVTAFEAGVDDYVTKPHSMRELLLRVRAVGRRRSTPPPSETLTIGQLSIDRAARRVDVAGVAIDLTRREFDVLVHLAERVGRVQTRESLVAEVWGEIADSGRVVDTTIKRVRKKLGANAPAIKTIRGVGYKLDLVD
jgi:two-component system, OmpR family, phosphate regulon response regulator PhoB